MQNNLIGFLKNLDHPTWSNNESFTNWLETILTLKPVVSNPTSKVYFLNLHYVSPRESKLHDISRRTRAYIYMHDGIQKIKGEYENAIRLYHIEAFHLCARMITQDWNETQRFRYYFEEVKKSDEVDCIVIPESIISCFDQIPIRTSPDHFDTVYNSIASKPKDSEVSHLREAICERCKLKNKMNCWNGHAIFLREIFGTFNLTLRAIKGGVFKNQYIDITFSPISIPWNNEDDVIAVLVCITGHDSGKEIQDTILQSRLMEYSAIVTSVHHRELLFELLQSKKLGIIKSISDKSFERIKSYEDKIAILNGNSPADVIPKEVPKLKKEKDKYSELMNGYINKVKDSKTIIQAEMIQDDFQRIFSKEGNDV